MKSYIFVLIALIYVHICTSDMAQKSYLTTYGYIDKDAFEIPCAIDDSVYERGIRDFQNFFSINNTGEINEETLKFMGLNRCGRRDNENIIFDVDGEKNTWRRSLVKYQIVNYPRFLSQFMTEIIIAKAFTLWREHINIKFKEVTENPDITVQFVTDEDDVGLNENDKTIATSNPAGLLGEIYIKDSIIWTAYLEYGNDLFMAVAHQIGHVLGLDHSNETDSIMQPIKKYFDSNYTLGAKDILEIKNLYSSMGNVSENFELCDALENLDSLFLTLNGKYYYVFVSEYFWKVNSNGTSIAGYPKLISSVWKIRGPISAAFQNDNGLIYLFKKDKYWKYQGNLMDNTSPHLLKDFSKNTPSVVNGAVYIDNKIYLRDAATLYIYDIYSDATMGYKATKSLRDTCSTIFVLKNSGTKELACIHDEVTYLVEENPQQYDNYYGGTGVFKATESQTSLEDVFLC